MLKGDQLTIERKQFIDRGILFCCLLQQSQKIWRDGNARFVNSSALPIGSSFADLIMRKNRAMSSTWSQFTTPDGWCLSCFARVGVSRLCCCRALGAQPQSYVGSCAICPLQGIAICDNLSLHDVRKLQASGISSSATSPPVSRQPRRLCRFPAMLGTAAWPSRANANPAHRTWPPWARADRNAAWPTNC